MAGSALAGNGGTAGAGRGGAGGVAERVTCGGAGGAAGTASSGASGGAAGAASGGVLIGCPSSPPCGACTTEDLACAYPTESCLCSGGAWTCFACPATQPANDDGFDFPDRRLSMSCRYGNVTCSIPIFVPLSLIKDSWSCGICPADRPTTGAACGNTRFECRYGVDTCACNQASWTCATPSCEVPRSQPGMQGCAGPGHYTCQFETQNCSCGGRGAGRRCTCPASRPADGSHCESFAGVGGNTSGCMYGATKCTCLDSPGSTWSCVDPVCPTSIPAPGSSCALPLSGASFCACDGAIWSCS
jgi:hypothetical protein